MAVPISQVLTVAKYALSNTIKGKKRYPLVIGAAVPVQFGVLGVRKNPVP